MWLLPSTGILKGWVLVILSVALRRRNSKSGQRWWRNTAEQTQSCGWRTPTSISTSIIRFQNKQTLALAVEADWYFWTNERRWRVQTDSKEIHLKELNPATVVRNNTLCHGGRVRGLYISVPPTHVVHIPLGLHKPFSTIKVIYWTLNPLLFSGG